MSRKGKITNFFQREPVSKAKTTEIKLVSSFPTNSTPERLEILAKKKKILQFHSKMAQNRCSKME
jgi:hypothetical protein